MSFLGADTAAHQPLRASDHFKDGKYHLLLAATGSVATIKIPNILEALSQYDNLSVRVVLSESATEFLQGQADEQPRARAAHGGNPVRTRGAGDRKPRRTGCERGRARRAAARPGGFGSRLMVAFPGPAGDPVVERT